MRTSANIRSISWVRLSVYIKRGFWSDWGEHLEHHARFLHAQSWLLRSFVLDGWRKARNTLQFKVISGKPHRIPKNWNTSARTWTIFCLTSETSSQMQEDFFLLLRQMGFGRCSTSNIWTSLFLDFSSNQRRRSDLAGVKKEWRKEAGAAQCFWWFK